MAATCAPDRRAGSLRHAGSEANPQDPNGTRSYPRHSTPLSNAPDPSPRTLPSHQPKQHNKQHQRFSQVLCCTEQGFAITLRTILQVALNWCGRYVVGGLVGGWTCCAIWRAVVETVCNCVCVVGFVRW